MVDSRASDHMTSGQRQFISLTVPKSNVSVKIADVSISIVIGVGNVRIPKDLVLKSVLLVPSLSFTLMLVSKLKR